MQGPALTEGERTRLKCVESPTRAKELTLVSFFALCAVSVQALYAELTAQTCCMAFRGAFGLGPAQRQPSGSAPAPPLQSPSAYGRTASAFPFGPAGLVSPTPGASVRAYTVADPAPQPARTSPTWIRPTSQRWDWAPRRPPPRRPRCSPRTPPRRARACCPAPQGQASGWAVH